jgi:hypothetical protein
MDELEMDRRVRFMRLCLHNRRHYLDHNGNRRCFSCDAFVRPNGTATIAAPE